MEYNRPTLKDIAKLTGVHLSVVSKVINGSRGNSAVSQVTREKIWQAAQQLGYRPKAAARMLKTRQSGIIGVLVKNSEHTPLAPSLTYEELQGIVQVLQPKGLNTILIRLTDFQNQQSNKFHERIFVEDLLDALIVLSCSHIDPSIMEKIRASAPLIIWVNSNYWEEFNCIRIDEYQGGQILGDFVLSQGYTKAIWAYRPYATHFSHEERRRGFLDAIQNQIPVEFYPIHNRPALSELTALIPKINHQVALIAVSSRVAEDLAWFFATNSLAIGQDIPLAVCESKSDFSFACNYLTRIEGYRCEMGMQAAYMLLEAQRKLNRQVPSCMIQPSLIPGQTLPLVYTR